MQDISRRERRNRTILVVITGVVALALVAAWAIILRRQPIEEDLTRRAEAALAAVGVDAGVVFEGRDGRVTVAVEDTAAARAAIMALDGVRTLEVAAAPTTTTTTTVPATTTTTLPPTTTTTTTTAPTPEASFTLLSDAGTVTLGGSLHPDDALLIVETAAATFGPGAVEDAIATDDRIDRPPWVTALADALPSLDLVAEPALVADGDGLTLSGDLSSEERRSAVLAAFSALGVEIADGMSIAAPPGQEAAAELEAQLNSALAGASVLFATGSTELSDEAAAQLDLIADLLQAVPGSRVEVGGHTDSEGPADGNLLLSRQRAEAVVAYLIGAGVDPVQLTAVGYGETRPIAENTTPEGRAANRRIAFIVEGSS